MTKLLSPMRLGDVELPNRVIMAPLTRSRADSDGRIPNDLMAEYYAQRASAGLIISEATIVDPMGAGMQIRPVSILMNRSRGGKRSLMPCTQKVVVYFCNYGM